MSCRTRMVAWCAPLALLAGLAAAPGAGAAGLPACTLREIADRAGVRIGAAFVEGRDDPGFGETLAREFNSVTAPLYWSETQPAPGTYDFTVADAAVAVAEAHGMRVRGHPLVWGRLALPEHVKQVTSADELRALMVDRIVTLVGRYAGRIAQYDVVNEPLTLFGAPGSTNGLDDNLFHRVLGPGYIREALDLARAADPDARLFVNDFFVEKPGPKQDRLFELARQLVESGAPLDGVGFQGHVRLPVIGAGWEPTAAEVEAAVRRFAALGLAVEITEMDVTLSSRQLCQLDFQRRAYHDLLSACFAVPACTGVTTWGITDAFTWIRSFFGVDGAPLLFDESYAPKPAYFGARDALLEKACATGDACSAVCMAGSCEPAAGCPYERAAGCCDVDADCPADACIAGRSCADHGCTEGASVCNDGDPCTVDSCSATDGCRPEPVEGFAAVGCVCERLPPEACAGQPLPPAMREHFDQACALIASARDARVREAKRLLRRAGERLRRARRLARAARTAGVSSGCVDAMKDVLRDARVRARRARKRP